MSPLFRFSSARPRHPDVAAWFSDPHNVLRQMALPWFERMCALGDDVRELLHDGCPTACVEDAAFAYVNAFNAHINIGFYFGAELSDPNGLLQGAGKRMRHAKIRWGEPTDDAAMIALIAEAYRDMRIRLASEARGEPTRS